MAQLELDQHGRDREPQALQRRVQPRELVTAAVAPEHQQHLGQVREVRAALGVTLARELELEHRGSEVGEAVTARLERVHLFLEAREVTQRSSAPLDRKAELDRKLRGGHERRDPACLRWRDPL